MAYTRDGLIEEVMDLKNKMGKKVGQDWSAIDVFNQMSSQNIVFLNVMIMCLIVTVVKDENFNWITHDE